MVFRAEDSEPFRPTWPTSAGAPERLDLKSERIETVIWATGYRRAYPWLRVPVLDASGEIEHDGGFTPAFGLYVLGMNFQRRRNSSFIDGVGADARAIAEQIARSRCRRSRSIVLSEGLRPSDSPTRSLARRFVGALRSRGSLAVARSRCRYLCTEPIWVYEIASILSRVSDS